MTQISRPWTSTAPGDAGPYSANNWNDAWKYLSDWGAKGDSGPLLGSGASPDAGLTVSQRGAGANMSVDVSSGAALVNGTYYLNDATANQAVASNSSGNPRIDTIVLNKDWSAQTVRLAVVQGTPAATPAPPSLVQTLNTQWQIPLADVAVANGAVTITNANITPRGAPANAGQMIALPDILNNSGVVLQTGDVVVWDTSADRAVKTSTTASDPLTAGVWIGRTAIGGYGRVVVAGLAYVNANAAVTRGQSLVQSGTAKQAAPITRDSQPQSIGMALQTTAGSGLVLTAVNTIGGLAQYLFNQRVIGSKNFAGGTATTTSTIFVDIDATNLIVTHISYSGRVLVIALIPTNENSTAVNYYDIIVDSTTRISGSGASGTGLVGPGTTGGSAKPIIVPIVGIATVTPGSHTYKPQWRSPGGVTLNQASSSTAQMWVIDV